ncbi:MAG TPA: hypothetical protein VLR71_11685 [Casimicrobiaceae bacterium]|nr:hypothetical protein [Casimicrobiaceae bacterium]
MQRKPVAMALAVAGTIGLAAAVPSFAADSGDNTNSKTNTNAAAQAGVPSQSGTTNSTGSSSNGSMSNGSTMRSGTSATTGTGTMSRSATGMAAGGQSFDKTGDSWANDYAAKNNGRISRKAYMDEMSRRWEAMDRNQQGLTPAEVSRMYGNVDSAAAPARTGSGVQGGNMGPGNQKAQ